MSNKQLVLEAVSQLPEDSTFDRIKEEIDILAAVRRGQEDVAAGRVVPQDRVREMIRPWATK